MRTVYLIGNGFDLMLGMKTRPIDFLQAFVHEYRYRGNSPTSRLAKSISTEGVETWSDFEMKIGDYSNNFSSDHSDSINEYLSQIDALERYLAEWLGREQERVLDPTLQNQSQKFFRSITNIIPLLDGQGIRFALADQAKDFDFICFNYTDTFRRMYNMVKKDVDFDSITMEVNLRSLVAPHGQLDKFVVCGVDGADQIANAGMRENREVVSCIVKEEIQRSASFDFDRAAQDTLAQADLICIYGMSLGRSDRRWWKSIVNALLDFNCPTSHVVVFSHGINREDLLTPRSRFKAQDGVRNQFCNAAEINSALAERVSGSIHVLPTALLSD